MPSFSLKKFSEILFRSCPLLHHWSHDHEAAFNDFMEYKTRVPVCGAIMLNESLTKVCGCYCEISSPPNMIHTVCLG